MSRLDSLLTVQERMDALNQMSKELPPDEMVAILDKELEFLASIEVAVHNPKRGASVVRRPRK